MVRMRGRSRLKWFRLILVGVVLYFGYVVLEQQSHLNEIDAQQQLAEQKLKEQQKIQKDLETEKKNLNEPEYVEKIAREELGMVKKGELPYISSNKN